MQKAFPTAGSGVTVIVPEYADEVVTDALHAELERMLEKSCRDNIVRILREIGFLHIAIDLEGYGQGRMNRTG